MVLQQGNSHFGNSASMFNRACLEKDMSANPTRSFFFSPLSLAATGDRNMLARTARRDANKLLLTPRQKDSLRDLRSGGFHEHRHEFCSEYLYGSADNVVSSVSLYGEGINRWLDIHVDKCSRGFYV